MTQGDVSSGIRRVRPVVAAWVRSPDGWRWHLRLAAAVAVALVLANVAATPERLWAVPVLGAWVTLLAVHGGLLVAPARLRARADRPGATAAAPGVLRRIATRLMPAAPAAPISAPAPPPSWTPLGPAPTMALPSTPTAPNGRVSDGRLAAVPSLRPMEEAPRLHPSAPVNPADAAVGPPVAAAAAPDTDAGAVLRDEIVALWGRSPSATRATSDVLERYGQWRWAGTPPPAAPSPADAWAAAWPSPPARPAPDPRPATIPSLPIPASPPQTGATAPPPASSDDGAGLVPVTLLPLEPPAASAAGD